jgi:hypothetical protein
VWDVTTRNLLRNGLRAVTVAGGTAVITAVSSPAFATMRDDGDEPGNPASTGTQLLFLVGVPIALFLIIALLVSVPSLARGPRYRPGLGWWAAPVWFGGPSGDAQAAVQAAEPIQEGGGASARW